VITNFRLEALGRSQEEVANELGAAAAMVKRISGVNEGLWQETDNVIEKKGEVHRGRIVFKATLQPKRIGPRG
jgi:predicted transcriptional regulator